MKKFYTWYQKHITGAIFIGLILGILTGLFLAGRFEPVLTVTSLLGSIYMNALNMMIFPLVFCSIIMGITSIGNARTTGKITGYSMIFFLCTTGLASLAGLIIPRLIRLGKGVNFEMATSDIQATEMTSILDTVKNLIPSNPVAAFANGNMLQVLVFAVIIGFTLLAIKEKGEPLLHLIDSCNEVCLKIISTVMYFTPIGVFCTIVPVVEANGTKTILSLATQLIILYVTFYGFALFIYGGSVKLLGKTSPVKFFKAIMPAALNAFGTCSSSATIPISKGGTGATTAAAARTNLGITCTSLYSGSLSSGSTTFNYGNYKAYIIVGNPTTSASKMSIIVPKGMITTSDVSWQIADEGYFRVFKLKYSGTTVTMTIGNGYGSITNVYGIN